MYMFLFTRVDKRFYVPDGSSKVRSYSGALNAGKEEKGNERNEGGDPNGEYMEDA